MEQTSTASQPLTLKPRDLRPNIYDLSPDRLTAVMVEWGEPAFRAKQVLHWLYKELVTGFEAMTNLPQTLRARLEETYRLGSAELVAQKISTDGWTRKVLLKMKDGSTVEAVLMLYYDRATVCVSSQVGCAMGCSFCATGQMGFTRNLTSGEILEQVLWFNRWLREHPHRAVLSNDARPRYTGDKAPHGSKSTGKQDELDLWHVNQDEQSQRTPNEISAVTNIVFMGMGEPLVNYANLWGAIRMLNSQQGLGLGARRMTVSTVGVVPQIRRMAHEEVAVNLAVSLHAPNDDLRSQMVPMNSRFGVEELMSACREYIEATKRRITFEYVLIKDVNDGLHLAHQLAGLLKGMLCHVNLIPLNPVPGTDMLATPREQVFAFQKIVQDAGIWTTVRIERGQDIAAACGQLKVQEEPNSHRRSLNPELVQAHVQADLAAAM
ncbi:MAG: 23S rRNA (adenine(2503)-C(2))-methyltransferase RlmN [Chloroflexota bacterium]|nr:23S rRNA (adenine(2503)-C(2))-methyltransferase RlmN [Chloroflexota bacterium]MDQ5865857.1 23S rRNA (adenine(2503)-C(2))-methyltransferase RlmN [Chloroflexota bacterium]